MKYSAIILAILSCGFQMAACVDEETKVGTQRHLHDISRVRETEETDYYPYLLKTQSNGQCVTVGSGSSVYIESCYGRSNQKWVYRDEQLINEADGKCLGVRHDGIIVATTCYEFSTMKWTWKNGMLVTGYHQDVCININNNVLNTYWCNGGINQKFELEVDVNPKPPQIPNPGPGSVPSPNQNSIYIVNDDNLCVNMSLDTNNDVALEACNFDGSDSEAWFYDQQSKTIVNKKNGKCLDVNESDPNKSIGVWPCHGRNNQKWLLDDSSRLISLGKCMKWNWNGDLSLKDCGGSYRQQRFDFVRGPSVQVIEYKPIRLSSIGNTCVDMATTKTNEKYNVSIKPCNGARNQSWFINTQQKTIVNEENDTYCLDVDIEDGYNLIAWECHGRANQQWVFDNFNRIRSELNKTCMSMNWRTRNLVLDTCHGGDNQEFWY